MKKNCMKVGFAFSMLGMSMTFSVHAVPPVPRFYYDDMESFQPIQRPCPLPAALSDEGLRFQRKHKLEIVKMEDVVIQPMSSPSKGLVRSLIEIAIPLGLGYVAPFIIVNNAHLVGRLAFEYGNDWLKLIPQPKTFSQMLEFVELREYCGNWAQKYLSHLIGATGMWVGNAVSTKIVNIAEAFCVDAPKAVFQKSACVLSKVKNRLASWWSGI